MIEILYTILQKPIPPKLFREYFEQLPTILKNKTLRYRKWKDKHSHLLGKLLLKKGLQKINETSITLDDIKYDKYARPYFNNEIDFNISHSGKYIICAISRETKLGIDIELKKGINFAHFKTEMTKKQWAEIFASENPNLMFLKYWTIKESVSKAIGLGLEIPLSEIFIDNNIASYRNKKWYITELNIDKEYSSHLATENKIDKKIVKIDKF